MGLRACKRKTKHCIPNLCALEARAEHSGEVSECFGGEEEGMIESNIGIKENINKESHNMTLKNLLEFSSAEMVSYIKVASQCDMQRLAGRRSLRYLHCCP